MNHLKSRISPFHSVLLRAVLAATAGVLAEHLQLQAASIPIPNGSFELQSGAGQPQGVNTNIDSWQKAAKPAYFDEAAYGLLWTQTAGAFQDTNPYANRTGLQAAYILSFPEAALFQDYNTVDFDDTAPSHAFNATFLPGNTYQFTLGVFGKQLVENVSSLQLSLYYRDALNAIVPIASNLITYHAASFPATATPLNLVNYAVTTAPVQASDAWAGKQIGIQIKSVNGTGQGYWDMDNAGLTVVPEPASGVLLAAAASWLLSRRRREAAGAGAA